MIKYTITKHIVGFPTKIASANGYRHIYNIRLTEDRDNMTLVGKGDYVTLDEYKQDAVPSGTGAAAFAGIIREQAPNGNWYVEVTADTDALLVYNSPIIAEDFTREFSDESNFFNGNGETVKAYTLCKGDIFEVSEAAFDGTPEADKTVTYNNTKNQYTVA